MHSSFQFREFLFHFDVGELIRRNGIGEETCTRLAPQPCRLLGLLLEHYPDVVSRETIRATLWPDVQVDFDRSLHFCVSQVRAALDDDPVEPKFIQTIPRRGYRWIAELKNPEPAGNGSIAALNEPLPIDTAALDTKVIPRTELAPTAKRRSMIAASIFFLGLALFLIFRLLPDNQSVPITESPTIRVAIMPFEPTDADSQFKENDIALRLVAGLTDDLKNEIEIIGPTTTSNYGPRQLQALADDYRIDCILNGKFTPGPESRLLAEIIRTQDGVHLWVQYFDAAASSQTISESIKLGLYETLNGKLWRSD